MRNLKISRVLTALTFGVVIVFMAGCGGVSGGEQVGCDGTVESCNDDGLLDGVETGSGGNIYQDVEGEADDVEAGEEVDEDVDEDVDGDVVDDSDSENDNTLEGKNDDDSGPGDLVGGDDNNGDGDGEDDDYVPGDIDNDMDGLGDGDGNEDCDEDMITLPIVDTFEGDSLNDGLWAVGRQSVEVGNDYLKISPCPGCGGGAWVSSVDYDHLNSKRVKIIKRSMVDGSRETQFYINFVENANISIFYKRGGNQNSLPGSAFSMTTWPRFETGDFYRRLTSGTWGEWFEESIEYDGNTGIIKYDYGNDDSYELVIDWVPDLTFINVTGSAWNGSLDNVQKWDWIRIIGN